jgi:LPS export ABC transporter protein LptC
MNRFHRKTNNSGITTIPVIVVMLLLLSASCSKEKKEVVEVAFDPEKSYTMRTTEMTTLISDTSGITRYRANAKEWLMFSKAAEPYWYFPEGLYLEKFDTLFQAEATVKSDTAYYYEKKDLWKLIGNVNIKNLEGEYFETSELYWDGAIEKVYSDKFIRIEQKEQVITGIGFESNQNMTKYKIFNSTGVFPVNEASRDTTTQKRPPE